MHVDQGVASATFFFLNNKFFLFATSTLVVIYAINNDVPFWNSSCASPVLIIGKNARRKIRREKCPHNLSGTNVYPLETLTGSVESDDQGKRLDVLSRRTPTQQQIQATSSRQ